MSQPAQRPVEPTQQAVPQDQTAFIKLLEQLGQSARAGAHIAFSDRNNARKWGKLESVIGTLLEQRAAWDVATVRRWNAAIASAARRELRTKSKDGNREADFAVFEDDVDRWSETWALLAPEQVLCRNLHRIVLWMTAWHLLEAGVAVSRVLRVLTTQGFSPRAPTQSRARIAMPTVTIPWWQSLGGFQSAATVGWRVSSNVGNTVVRGVRQGLAAQAAARHNHAVKVAEAAQRRASDQALKAKTEAQQRPAPVRMRDARSETPTAPATSLQLDGSRLHRSIVPTWLSLVFLSWVSLIWGGMISAPIGVGFGILVAAVAGIFVVPLWGTVFGILGMGPARSATLTTMGFTKLPDDSPLARTSAAYARALGIAAPSIGTVNVYNAFAMGTDRNDATVALGQPLLEHLTERETEAVLGHELGHVVSGDMRRMMLMRTFQNATVWFMMFQGVTQLARWIICWAAELYILSHSRKREYWADAIGAGLAGKDAMIGALKKLEQAPELSGAERTHARFMVRGRSAGLLSTHPSFEQRIAALESESYIRRLPSREV